jgi:hypothetical protein
MNLSDFDEPEMKVRLLAVSTGLTLPRDYVDELVASEIARFLGQRNPLLRCAGNNTSLGPYLCKADLSRFFAVSGGLPATDAPTAPRNLYGPGAVGNDRIGLPTPSAAPTAATSWRTWKYRRIEKDAAAAARCLRVCPLERPPAE